MKILMQAIVFVICYCLNAYAAPFFKDLGYALGIYVTGDLDGAALFSGLSSGLLTVLVYAPGFVVAKRIRERKMDGILRSAPGVRQMIFSLLMFLADAAITDTAEGMAPIFGSGNLVVPVSGSQFLHDLFSLMAFHWIGVLGLVSLIYGLVAFCRRVPATTWSTVHKAEANTDAQQFNLNDPEYGLVPEKPVYCFYFAGSLDYLDSLRTENGEKLLWSRRGSKAVGGIKGMVDIYDSTLPSGQSYKTVYVNMYANSNSTTAPAGFVFYHSEQKTVTPAPAASKPKTRFCKLCGGLIDPVTRKCTGCRKQYFRLPTFAGNRWLVVATAVSCVITLLLLFALWEKSSQIDVFRATIADQERTIDDLEMTIADKSEVVDYLKQENRDMRKEIWFYDNHVVFIGDDGTKKYHKYGCDDLDLSYFWAYNTEAANDKGYKPCSKCCN